MKEQKFFICKICGNLVAMINSSGAKMVCCGQEMTELTPNTVEASHEKHLPVVKVEGNTVTVKVGSVPHPMTEEHLIQWIFLKTKRGGQRKALKAGEAPEAVFTLVDDAPYAAYAYCNLHGLWKTDL
jgi:superoxide reductase